jgi:DNA mismatch repair protein MutS2
MGLDGKQKIHALTPKVNKEEIELSLDHVCEWLNAIEEGDTIPFSIYENIEEELYLLQKIDYVLEVDAIQKLHRIILLAYDISVYFKDFTRQKKRPKLFEICELISLPIQLSKEIIRVFDDEGEVRPNASEKLLKISKSIANKERELDKVFKVELSKYAKNSYLAENQESMRNGRRVLTAHAEHKRKINGVIHDESSTGKMIYIEPAETIIINNEIFNLHTERRKEIYKILRDLCGIIRPFHHDINNASNIIIRLDVIRAKALFAKTIQGVKPSMVNSSKLAMLNAYNPILKLKLESSDDEMVPFNLELFKPNRILVLSGPNAGGKSVTMKTVGLLQIMLQSGILIPVDQNSKFGIFKNIFVDIGDQQSLEDDLSTYSSHLNNMKAILDNVNKDSLVLIDEFGSGTDPKIGGAMAEAILHQINNKKAFGVITTHYSNLKFYAYKMPGILNGSMEFDKSKLTPTYQLIVGRPGSSFAFEIAQKTGLPDKVISNARKKAGKNENALEQMLIDLQEERREIQLKMASTLEKEERIDRLIKNYNSLHAELEFQRKKIKLDRKEAHLYQTSSETKELQKLIKEIRKSNDLAKAEKAIKKQKLNKERLKSNVKELKEEVFETANISEKDLEIGKFVRLRNSDSIGKIINVDEDKIELEMGFLKMTVDKKELIPSKEPIKQNTKKSVDTSQVSGIGGHIETKLDIRGYKVDDAMWFLEEFIERAIMNNVFELKIIHGIGNGILKKNVHKKLREYKDIQKVWHPEDEFGGQSVTLVKI